ncbi:hypothetical protein [Pseudoroseomonas sp. WGS1072]|uniref:hypothetical protein n=1 Tax=Roseomonas sp. WGS1072 TaxID=3366816 RepID=UPI003BF0B7F0
MDPKPQDAPERFEDGSVLTESLHIRLASQMKELLEVRARSRGVKVSDMARDILERALFDDQGPSASDRILTQLQELLSRSQDGARDSDMKLLLKDTLEMRHLLVASIERASLASIVSRRVLTNVLPQNANKPAMIAEVQSELDDDLEACQITARHHAGKQQPAANTNQKVAGQ